MTARPARLRTAAALLLLGVTAVLCASLGRWQLERAELRRQAQREIAQGQNSPPLALGGDTPVQALLPWRQASASGNWRHDLSLLIENRNLGGRPGYWVATPLQLADGHAVLVLRGWLPRGFDGKLPVIPAPQGPQDIRGQLLAYVPRIYELPTREGREAASLPQRLPDAALPVPVVTNLALADYARATSLTLLPAVLQQLPDAGLAPQAPSADGTGTGTGAGANAMTGPGKSAASGPGSDPNTNDSASALIQQWEGPSLDADKNIGYAIQWFSFAAIALGAWLVVAWRAWRRRPHQP